MFFTLNIMENIRYFNTKFSHFNYIFKIIQYILYYCRILYLPPRRWHGKHVGSWWMVEGVPLLLSSSLHLQVQVSSSSSSPWAPADGIAVVRWHLQLQVLSSSSSAGTCSCRCCHRRLWVPAGVWWPLSLVVEVVVVVVVVVVMVVTVVDRGGW